MKSGDPKLYYEFGPFRLDVTERLLFRANVMVPLTPKTLDTLLVLVENSERLVEKDELMKRLWPDTFVEEANLAHHISQLRKVFEDGANENKFIQTVPRRGYRWVATVKERREDEMASAPQAEAASEVVTQAPQQTISDRLSPTEKSTAAPEIAVSSHPKRRAFTPLAIASVCIALVVTVAFLLKPKAGLPPLRVTPFASDRRRETKPTFSPDGNYLAYEWSGEQGDNRDIYLKPVNGGLPLRLTADPANDLNPAWSPDGRHVAFVRRSKEGAAIYETTVPAGPERKIANFRPGPEYLDGRRLDWSPDGKSLAVADMAGSSKQHAIFLVSVDTGDERQLTSPATDDLGDVEPAFSPDGSQLAFVRESHYLVRELYLIPSSGGEAKRLTFDNKKVLGIAWTPDGREIVFSSDPNGGYTLRRIPATGGQSVPVAGTSGFSSGWGNHIDELSIARQGNRMAYTQWFQDINAYRIEAPNASAPIKPPEPVNATSQWESDFRYSPDGKRLAFASDRLGNLEIFVCESDGSNTFQLTHLGEPETGSPRWSPDGQFIAFDSRHNGNSDIFIVKASGGEVRRLTTDNAEDAVPFWSPDGRSVYFSSKRSGDWQIWRVPSEGGEAVQITHQDGVGPAPSPDGKFVYYAKSQDMNVDVWRVGADGANEGPVPGFNKKTWLWIAVTENGIYFEEDPRGQHPSLEFFDLKTRQYKTILTIEKSFAFGLDVSPDGRSIIYSVFDRNDCDIMMAENFR